MNSEYGIFDEVVLLCAAIRFFGCRLEIALLGLNGTILNFDL